MLQSSDADPNLGHPAQLLQHSKHKHHNCRSVLIRRPRWRPVLRAWMTNRSCVAKLPLLSVAARRSFKAHATPQLSDCEFQVNASREHFRLQKVCSDFLTFWIHVHNNCCDHQHKHQTSTSATASSRNTLQLHRPRYHYPHDLRHHAYRQDQRHRQRQQREAQWQG